MGIDNQSSQVVFKVKKLGLLKIEGSISNFSGEVSFDKDELSKAKFNVCVNPESINTGNAKRNEHLRSTDFFHTEKHHSICFQSSSIQSNNNNFLAGGIFAMRGVSQEVSIPFSIEEGLMQSQFSLNRLDFGLGAKFPAFFIRKTIQIFINSKIN